MTSTDIDCLNPFFIRSAVGMAKAVMIDHRWKS